MDDVREVVVAIKQIKKEAEYNEWSKIIKKAKTYRKVTTPKVEENLHICEPAGTFLKSQQA